MANFAYLALELQMSSGEFVLWAKARRFIQTVLGKSERLVG